jgi:hypothetical protein
MPRSHLGYGDPRGSEGLRRATAAYLQDACAVRCNPGQIIITCGTQHAIDLVVRTLLPMGSEVWVEDPGYLLTREALLPAGVKADPGRYPRDIAFTRTAEIKANSRKLVDRMMSREARDHGFYPVIATHDDRLQAYARERAAANGWRPGEYEFEMLLGRTWRCRGHACSRGRARPALRAVRARLVALCGA